MCAFAVTVTVLKKTRNQAIHRLTDASVGKAQEHQVAVVKVRSEAEVAEDLFTAERDGSKRRYHDVLQSVRWIVKPGDEPNFRHTDTRSKLRFLFDERRKVAALTPPD